MSWIKRKIPTDIRIEHDFILETDVDQRAVLSILAENFQLERGGDYKSKGCQVEYNQDREEVVIRITKPERK